MLKLLSFFGIDTADYNHWELTSEAFWYSDFRLVLLVLLALLLVYFGWRSTHRLANRPGRRKAVFALRLAALAIVVMILAEPAIRIGKISRIAANIAVLIDSSSSMSYGGTNRFDRSVKFLISRRAELEKLERSFNVDYYLFDGNLQRINYDALADAKPLGEATDFLETFSTLSFEYPPETLVGTMLISDGVDNGPGGAARLQGKIDRAVIDKLPGNLHTYLAGNPSRVIDAAITEVVHDSYGFIRNTFKLKARISLSGIKSGNFAVTLKQGNTTLNIATIVPQAGQDEYEVELKFTPERVGRFIYTLQIPTFAGEIIEANNRRMFSIEVIRDKIRALQVVGHPSWDERFLRRLLKQDPNIDLISFFILRTRTDDNTIPKDELSLIPFPDKEIFEDKIHTFDLIILQNFDYRPYFGERGRYIDSVSARKLLGNIRRFVVEFGGGLVMIGGDESFSEGGYFASPLESVLPVRLLPTNRSGDGNVNKQPFRMTLSDTGRGHPITRLNYDARRNNEMWTRLPELYGVNLVRGLAPGALALGFHPTLRAEDGPLPVLAVREVGKGRTMSLLADSSWRWDFINVGRGASNREYITFWRNAIRWLIRDPETKLIEVGTDLVGYTPGQKIYLKANVFERDYRQVRQGKIDLTLYREGKAQPLEKVRDAAIVDGVYYHEFTAGEPGFYRVKASARGETGDLGQDEAIFSVEQSSAEMAEPKPDLRYMEMLANESGGQFHKLSDEPQLPDFEHPDQYRMAAKLSLPLWDNAWMLALVILLLAGEWFLRRRSGLR
jgi:uncharacterized membrane protein